MRDCACAHSLLSRPALCSPVDPSPPGSSLRGIFQARILEWVATPSPRHLPYLGMEPMSPGSPMWVSGFCATSHLESPHANTQTSEMSM